MSDHTEPGQDQAQDLRQDQEKDMGQAQPSRPVRPPPQPLRRPAGQPSAADPASFGKVGVLLGGRSAEREVSFMSGEGVLAALRAKGIDAHGFDTGTQSLLELAQQGFDRVFIALHGRYGEDGSFQGVLEQLGIPYTGSGVAASALAMDKILTKMVWLQRGLPTPRHLMLDATSDLARVPDVLGLPLILKPPHEGSTIGITKVSAAAAMGAAFAAAAEYDEVVLAEEFIQGREFTVAVLGRGRDAQALPVIEIVAPEGNYDYENKYFSEHTQYICPARLEPAMADEMRRLALEAYTALDCEGWGRADILLRESDGKPFLLELNTSPGMTSHSLVPIAARAVGIGYDDLCVKILQSARLKLANDRG